MNTLLAHDYAGVANESDVPIPSLPVGGLSEQGPQRINN